MDPGRHTAGPSGRPPCLVVGCGYVGTRLARRLAADRDVRAIARNAAKANELRALGIDVLPIDLDTVPAGLDSLRAASAGAAISYLAPPPETTPSDTRLASFLAALGDAHPALLLYMSTTGVYGDTGGAAVSEQSPLSPTSERALRRVSAEGIAADWCASRRVRCVILRVPGIYGPDRLPLERLRRGEPVLRPEDAGPGNRIHVDDLVSACVAALDSGASGPINVTDGDHSTTSEFVATTAELAGLPPPRFVTRAEAQVQISPGLLAFLGEARRVDNTRMREVLRVRLKYPDMRSGVAASLAEMQATRRS
jgi:nucleoside-diphosphate-sugar epimerase